MTLLEFSIVIGFGAANVLVIAYVAYLAATYEYP